MKTFKIQDREAGNVIATGLPLEQAKQEVKLMEKEDLQNGDFVPDFYEIIED